MLLPLLRLFESSESFFKCLLLAWDATGVKMIRQHRVCSVVVCGLLVFYSAAGAKIVREHGVAFCDHVLLATLDFILQPALK